MSIDNDIQNADALAKANARMSAESGNKPVYIVRVEDPANKQKYRDFLVFKLNELPAYLEIVGIDKTLHNKLEINTYQDIQKLSKEGTVKIENIKFPWNRILYIQKM